MILEDIDPRTVGFPVADKILSHIKRELSSGRFTRKPLEVLFWKDIQEHIPHCLEHDLYGARAFFDWFRDLDIAVSRKP